MSIVSQENRTASSINSHQAILDAIDLVCQDVLSTSFHMKGYQEQLNGTWSRSQILGDIIAMTGLTSHDFNITVWLCLPNKIAHQLPSVLKSQTLHFSDGDAYQAVGYMVNQIAHCLGQNLTGTDDAFKCSLPTVLLHKNEGTFYATADVAHHAVISIHTDALFVSVAIKYKDD